jgi:hypothetical protein
MNQWLSGEISKLRVGKGMMICCSHRLVEIIMR